MARIFYFLARTFSYSFAVAIITVVMGLFVVSFGYFLGTSFLTSAYEHVLLDIKTWIPWALSVPILLYLLQFGLLSPIKIPAFFKFMRDINNNFTGDKLNPDISDDDLNRLYNRFTNLPVYNMLHILFFTAIAGVFLFGLIYFNTSGIDEYFTAANMLEESGPALSALNTIGDGGESSKILNQLIKIITISEAIILVLLSMSSYLLTDILTGHERATCYNELRERNFNIRPRAIIGLMVKFNFIVVLMIIALLTFGALIERGRLEGEANLSAIIFYFLISIFAGLALMYVTANSILRVFRDISRVALDIAAGKEISFHVLPLETEFADIEYTILEMNREIGEHRRNLEKKVEERTAELRTALSDLKERDDMVQKQLDMAGTIQRGILPGKIMDWNELKFSVRYFSMDKIGGDFYDVYQMKGNKLTLFVADVSGHGIPAALVTTMAKVSFGNAFLKHDSPKKIFQEVNQDLLDHIKTQDYLTCFIVTFDEEYNITYSNASHQKAIILRSSENRVELLDTGGLFIGAIENARETYEEKTSKLNYGDRLILYTDGIPEAANSNKEEYSNNRFEQVILQNKDLQLEDFTGSIIEDLQVFIGGAPTQDDITLLVIELARDETIDIIRRVKKITSEEKHYEAIEILRKGLEKYPDNKNFLYNISKSYFRLNNFEQVIKYVTKYIENDKNNKYAYYLAGAAYFQLTEYDQSINFFERALSLDSIFVNALFALGMSYKKKGLKDEAGRCFEKVNNIDEDNKMAAYELNELKSR